MDFKKYQCILIGKTYFTACVWLIFHYITVLEAFKIVNLCYCHNDESLWCLVEMKSTLNDNVFPPD